MNESDIFFAPILGKVSAKDKISVINQVEHVERFRRQKKEMKCATSGCFSSSPNLSALAGSGSVCFCQSDVLLQGGKAWGECASAAEGEDCGVGAGIWRLCYVRPRMGQNWFGGEAVTYESTGTNKKWERIESYGPKSAENSKKF